MVTRMFSQILYYSLSTTSSLLSGRRDVIVDGLNKIDSEKIVNKYLKIIEINPSLHDKIEFDLVETCYSFNTEKRLNKLFLPNLVKKYLFFLKKNTQKIIVSLSLLICFRIYNF